MGAQLSCQHCTVIIAQQKLDIPCVKPLQLQKPGSTVPMIHRCAWAWTASTPEIVKAWVVLEKLVGLQSVQAQSKLTSRLDEVSRTASRPAVLVPV
ncbi:hypothetical protein MMC22_005563 [Lobaria immixta]|nr:hypothetical protein [Lobaria immixta]